MLYLVRERHARGDGRARRPARAYSGPALAQVFEYLDTDLKKFMDLTGRGSANPLPPATVQARRAARAGALTR